MHRLLLSEREDYTADADEHIVHQQHMVDG
jgi:hypothetical protein